MLVLIYLVHLVVLLEGPLERLLERQGLSSNTKLLLRHLALLHVSALLLFGRVRCLYEGFCIEIGLASCLLLLKYEDFRVSALGVLICLAFLLELPAGQELLLLSWRH